jgi:hypothetical protein
VLRPIGRETIPSDRAVVPCLQAVIGCQQHEQSVADLCAGADLCDELLVSFRNDHLINTVVGTRFDPHKRSHVFADPMQELEKSGLWPPVGVADMVVTYCRWSNLYGSIKVLMRSLLCVAR